MPDSKSETTRVATILAPRRYWCQECQGDGCLMCECTGDNAAWRAMSMEQRAAVRDDDLREMLSHV